jgi:hypothetical protein
MKCPFTITRFVTMTRHITRLAPVSAPRAVIAVIPVLLLTLIVSGCHSSHSYVGSFRRTDIPGAVYGERPDGGGRHGVAGARIRVDEGKPYVSDANGRFLLPRMRPGRYTLRITHDDYLPVEREVEVFNRSQAIYVRMERMETVLSRIALAVTEGDYERAARAAEGVVRRDGDNAVARYALALAALERGNPRAARHHLDAVPAELRRNRAYRSLHDALMRGPFP